METHRGCKLLPLTLDLMAKYLWQETNFWLVIYECYSMPRRSVTYDSATPWTVACQASLFMEIPQARILELVAMPFSRGSSPPRNWTRVSCIVGGFLSADLPGKPHDLRVEFANWKEKLRELTNSYIHFVVVMQAQQLSAPSRKILAFQLQRM